MDITLTFKDPQEEINYGLYSHKIDFNLFRRLLYSMLLGSFSGSVYFLIIGNYLYITLGSYMFIQTIIAILLSKKSIQYLNIVALVYQIEIQTLLATLITLLDNSLQRGTIMIITTAAFQMSVCLSIGTKCTLKLLVSLYSTMIQLSRLDRIRILLPFVCLSSDILPRIRKEIQCFSNVKYFSFSSRLQKYTLHQNAQKIKENLLNQIEIPILKCFSNENDLKLIYQESNKCAQNTLRITDQNSFIKFTREVIILEGKTTSILTKQSSTLQFSGKQNLEQLIHRFFKKQVGEDSILHKTFQAYRCRVKHLSQEYLCQLILLHEDQPLCVIYLQKTYDDFIIKTNEKMVVLNQLLKRCVKENFEKISTQQECISLLYRNLKQNNLTEIINKLAQELFSLNIFFANCKILFNSQHLHFTTKKQHNLIGLVQQIVFHFKHSLQFKSIQVSLKSKSDIMVEENDILIRQLFYNIIENAIQFAKDKIKIEINSNYDTNINYQIIEITFSNTIELNLQKNNSESRQLRMGHLVVNKILKLISPYSQLQIYQDESNYSVKFYLFHQF